MANATQPIGQPLRRYETPALLADIELLDLLELSGSTVETAHLLNLSQPTVSRRRRQLGAELALELAGATRQEGGMRFGDSSCLRLLRRAAKRHRLDGGVWRLAGDGWQIIAPPAAALPTSALLPIPPRFRSLERWQQLVRCHVLDGALISGQEVRQKLPDLPAIGDLQGATATWPWLGCVLVPLGTSPLQLVYRSGEAPDRVGIGPGARVLMPALEFCGGLAQALRQQQLRPLHLSPSRHQPQDWLAVLGHQAETALVTPEWHQTLLGWGAELATIPLPRPIQLEHWLLVHRRDWSKQPGLPQLLKRNQTLRSPGNVKGRWIDNSPHGG